MSKDNALSFVGQIMTAYKAVMKAEGQALKYAIECGEALNLAKENVESTKPKGKWKDWLAEHCKEIPPRTERLYRQLASAVAEDANIFADCESIRKKLNESDDDEDGGDKDTGDDSESDEEEDEEESGNALPLGKPTSEDLTSMLQNSAVDEIGKALQDANKLDEVETAVITRMTPDKVSSALTKAWTADQLRDLIKLVNAYLTTLTPTAPAPSPYRRAPQGRITDGLKLCTSYDKKNKVNFWYVEKVNAPE
jgi:hypothetical protein